MESKEQIDKRSSATESAAAMHEDAINLPADDEDADKPGLQVNSRMLPLAKYQRFEWLGAVMVRAWNSRLRRSPVRLPVFPLSANNLGQVVHTHAPLSPSSAIWYRSGGGDALRLGR